MTAALFERSARVLIASRRSEGTRKLYTNDLKAWLAFCKTRKLNPADPPPETATTYRDALLAHPYAALTVRRILSALSKMYKAALVARAAAWNPFDAEALPRPAGDSFQRTEAIPDDVARAIIEKAAKASLRDELLLRLLWDTGMRRDEVVRLKRENLIARDGRTVVGFYGKGGKWREATLPESTAALLASFLKTHKSDWLFPGRSGKGQVASRPINLATVNKIVTRYMKLAGHEGAHPHQFRAAFATTALDKMPLHEVQAAMGHADPRTTQGYDRRQRGVGVADAVAAAREGKRGEK